MEFLASICVASCLNPPRWLLLFSSSRGHGRHSVPTVLGQQEHKVTIFLLHYLPKLRENNITIDFALGFPLKTVLLYSNYLFSHHRHVWKIKMNSLLLCLSRTLLNKWARYRMADKFSLFLSVTPREISGKKVSRFLRFQIPTICLHHPVNPSE